MKIIHMAIMALIIGVPVAIAAVELPLQIQSAPTEEKHHSEGAIADLQQLVQCQAVNLSLVRLHSQVATSMSAMSGPTGKASLKPMIDGYLAMAKSEEQTSTGLTYVIKQALIPSIIDMTHQPKEMIYQQISQHLNAAMTDIMVTLASPEMSFEDRVGAEQALIDEANKCDTLSQKVMRKNSY